MNEVLNSLILDEEIKKHTLTHLFKGESFCFSLNSLTSFFSVSESEILALLDSCEITSDSLFTLALKLKENQRASSVKLALVDVALDLINLSTGGGSTIINSNTANNNGSTFEEILCINSGALVRLKERE